MSAALPRVEAFLRELQERLCAALENVAFQALDLRGRVGAAHARMVEHVFDRLIPGPTLGVDPGIDDQARRTKQE